MKTGKNRHHFFINCAFPNFLYICLWFDCKNKIVEHMKTNSQTEKLVNKHIFVDLRQDPGFKAVFADINNKSLLIELLNEILPENAQIKDIIKYLDREQIVKTAYSKKSVLDLVCVSDDLRTFDVEIQCKKDVVFFERCIYYASGFYSRSILKGEDYDKLHPVYIVSFLDFTLDFENKAGIDSSKIITKYTMVEESTKIFAPSTILCIFAQLPRFKLELSECKTRRDFLFYWFKYSWSYESIPEALEDVPLIKDIVEASWIAGFSQEKLENYEMDMKTELDYRWELKQERLEGREEGREEGVKMKALETAKKMLADGLSIDLIAKYTGLSIETVGAL